MCTASKRREGDEEGEGEDMEGRTERRIGVKVKQD